MQCPKCHKEIVDESKNCTCCGTAIIPNIGSSTNKINSKKSKNKWDLSVWSLILTSLSIFQYITLFIKIPENEFILFLSFIVGFLALIGQILAIFSLIEIKHGEVPKKNIIYVSLSLLIGIFTIWLPFTIDEIRSFREAQQRSRVSRVKVDQQSLAIALEAYFVTNSTYPSPDQDTQGRYVTPHVLTTPVAFITNLPKDPFKDNGKGLYGYAKLVVSGDTGSQEHWIVTSYGPDWVDGNSGSSGGSILDISKAVTDASLGFPLATADLTYDPSNGTTSAGDVWRRGP